MDAHLEWLQLPLRKHLLDRNDQPNVLLRPVRYQFILFLRSLVCESVFEQSVDRKLALSGGDFRVNQDIFRLCPLVHPCWLLALSHPLYQCD